MRADGGVTKENLIYNIFLTPLRGLMYIVCMKQRLPIGIQDFVSIREGGFVYVDKTKRIHDGEKRNIGEWKYVTVENENG